MILDRTCYRVFAGPESAGNPITLFATDELDDTAALMRSALRSASEDNVYYALESGSLAARFFSRHGELYLCGHGLLALAHHVKQDFRQDRVQVNTPRGPRELRWREGESWIAMPGFKSRAITDDSNTMAMSLGGIGLVYRSLLASANDVWIVLLDGPARLARLDAESVAALETGAYVPGALIAAAPAAPHAYALRYFAPWHGKPEDIGTGSAHCYLAPLLLAPGEPGKARQYSAAGVTEMQIMVEDDKVLLSGSVEADRGVS